MIRYTRGNILDADTEALVNTVNTVGVMGKGIALMFRQAFPDNYENYRKAVKAGDIQTGRIFAVKESLLSGSKWILNFPTKKHWRQPSRMEWIESGLTSLRETIVNLGIRSVAIPALGCGAGGLDWHQVKPRIEAEMSVLPDVDVIIYEPVTECQNQPKRDGVTALTPPRAMISELVRRYQVLGFECTYLEVQKLAWLLERNLIRNGIQSMDLRFKPDRYGPYSDRLRHLLNALDGSYLLSEKRSADASPLDTIRFNAEKGFELQQYLDSAEMKPYRRSLEQTAATIIGFETPFGMELLASVDWLLSERKTPPEAAAIETELKRRPGKSDIGQRKARLFQPPFIHAALERLQEVCSV